MDVRELSKNVVSLSDLSWTGDMDIIVINTAMAFAPPFAYYVVPLSLHIGLVSGATPVANEHVRVQLLNLGDATVTGTADALAQHRIYRGQFPGDGNDLVADVMCGTLTTQTGGMETLLDEAWNLMIPFDKVWEPDSRPFIEMLDDGSTLGTAIGALAVRLPNAGAAAYDISASLTFAIAGPFTF